jgi:hypothetical protein
VNPKDARFFLVCKVKEREREREREKKERERKKHKFNTRSKNTNLLQYEWLQPSSVSLSELLLYCPCQDHQPIKYARKILAA